MISAPTITGSNEICRFGVLDEQKAEVINTSAFIFIKEPLKEIP